MNYKTGEGSIKDLEAITGINEIVFGGTKTPREIETKLSLHKNFHITLGLCEKEIVSYGVGYEERKKYYLWMLAVLPQYRGRGLGSRIMEEQIDFAKQNGYLKFLVKTSNKWRDMLKILVRKGFDIVGFKANEWGTDSAVWFEKDLDF